MESNFKWHYFITVMLLVYCYFVRFSWFGLLLHCRPPSRS